MPQPAGVLEPNPDDRVDAAIAEYLQARDQGQTPDRETFLRKYPELAADLAAFFDDQDHFESLASSLQIEKTTQSAAEEPAATLHLAAPTVISEGFSRKRLGDYELQDEIARGGMGVVYRAVQLSLQRPVAIKMILHGRWASADELARFRREAEAAARLDHPNIVPIYEVGECDGQPFFSMKLIQGRDLTHHRPRFLSAPRDAARLVAALAAAIHHAHQRGILHRDLKPQNILLDEEGKPQLTDFGLAKLVETEGSLTQRGTVVGTASYMAPEQARAEGPLTTAADVYSLGAILYDLLTGRPPFRGETPVETLFQVLHDDPPRPRHRQSAGRSRPGNHLSEMSGKRSGTEVCLGPGPGGRPGPVAGRTSHHGPLRQRSRTCLALVRTQSAPGFGDDPGLRGHYRADRLFSVEPVRPL